MRKLLALLLAGCMALSMAGCGGGSGSDKSAQDQASAPAGSTGQTAQAEGTGASAGELHGVDTVTASECPSDAKEFGEYSADNPLEIKMAHLSSATSHLQIFGELFKANIEDWTDGAVTVTIYNGGTMGTDKEILDQVVSGTLQMGVNNTSIMTNYTDIWSVLDLPYLFSDYEYLYRFLDSNILQDMCDKMVEETGARVLSVASIGYRALCSVDGVEVKSLADMSGLKYRVTESSLYTETFKAWDGVAIAMSGAEIMNALQNKTIIGCDHTPVTLYTGSQKDLLKNITCINHAAHFTTLDINDAFYQSLPADLQNLISLAAKDASRTLTEWEEADTETYLRLLEQDGAAVVRSSELDLNEWKEASRPVIDHYLAASPYADYAEEILSWQK